MSMLIVSQPVNRHSDPEPEPPLSSHQPNKKRNGGPGTLRNQAIETQKYSCKKDTQTLWNDIVRNNDWHRGLCELDDKEFKLELKAKEVELNDKLVIDRSLIELNSLQISHAPNQAHTKELQLIENTKQNLQLLRAIALNTPEYIRELQSKGVVCAESFYERSDSIMSHARKSIIGDETHLPLQLPPHFQKRLLQAIDLSLVCLQRPHQVTPAWQRYVMAAGAVAAITPIPLAVSFVAGEKNLQVMTIGRTFTTAFLGYSVAHRPTTDAKSIRSFMFRRGFVVNVTNCLFLPTTLIPYFAKRYPFRLGLTKQAADSFAKTMHSLGLKYSAPAGLAIAASMIILELKYPQRAYNYLKTKLRTTENIDTTPQNTQALQTIRKDYQEMQAEVTAARDGFLAKRKKFSDVLDAQTSDLLNSLEQVILTIDEALPQSASDDQIKVDAHLGKKLSVASFNSLVALVATPTSLPDAIATMNSAANFVGLTAISFYKGLDKHSTLQQEVNLMRDYNGLSLMMLPPFVLNKLPKFGGFIQHSKLGYNLTAAWFCAATSGMVGPITRFVSSRLLAEVNGQGVLGFVGSKFKACIGSRQVSEQALNTLERSPAQLPSDQP
jgi:hypothetical protein